MSLLHKLNPEMKAEDRNPYQDNCSLKWESQYYRGGSMLRTPWNLISHLLASRLLAHTATNALRTAP
ncbi:hypothetical protein L1987_16957 [Smallanthus sonchifolius]|uniref:Uncharacterized protein n=1 Tax=Smallanthus sonchifolius TaxID=185202 RepID=A0ACB9IW58_9ASTR|nr:hypothetical protein L1987_16957 [Smallanthus sonchifolius]